MDQTHHKPGLTLPNINPKIINSPFRLPNDDEIFIKDNDQGKSQE